MNLAVYMYILLYTLSRLTTATILLNECIDKFVNTVQAKLASKFSFNMVHFTSYCPISHDIIVVLYLLLNELRMTQLYNYYQKHNKIIIKILLVRL